METTTGGINVDIKQDKELLWNVSLVAESTTGGIEFSIEVQGGIGAISRITTEGGVEGIVRERVDGFVYIVQDYPPALLLSDNYPAGNNFVATLRTTTGEIKIDAEYAPLKMKTDP